MDKAKNILGEKYGRWTVVERAENNKRGQARWKCICSCRNKTIRIIDGYSLRSGGSLSCGCLRKDNPSRRTHGMTGTKIHNNWFSIKERCYTPSCTCYYRYGGRGIKMYDEWVHDFQAFYDYVSKLPHFGEKRYSINRIDNDGNYEPGNVEWSTKTEQANNRRSNCYITHNCKTQTISMWAKEIGINYQTLYCRLFKHNWSIEKALNTPVK